jgi:hypothetical protein
MRTTVELSDPVYRRLKAEAVERGIRGFSPIVEEALAEHFQSGSQRQRLAEAIKAAEGAWSDMDVEAWERDVDETWATWRLPPS